MAIKGFGMPTLIELPRVEDNVRLCADLGLDFIELNMSFPQYQLESMSVSELLRLKDRYGVYFTLHLPERLDVCDFSPAVSEAYAGLALAAVEFARLIGAPLVNMHMENGIYITLPERRVYLYEEYAEHYLRSIEGFRAAVERLSPGVLIGLENTDGFTAFQKRALDILLGSERFALTYDIGHDHTASKGDGEYITRRKAKLCHMHIHDALGEKNHLALGDGDIKLDEKLSLAAETGSRCVLETKTVEALKTSAEYLQTKGFLK